MQVCVMPAAPGGGIDLDALSVELYSRGVIQAMVEGGGQVIGSWISERRAQELQLYVGACALGKTSTRWMQAPLAENIDQAQRWRLLSTEEIGDDVVIRYAIHQ